MLMMMRLFTIRFRMLGAIAAVMSLLLLVGGAGMFGMYTTQSLSDDFVDHAFADAGNAARLQHAVGQLRLNEREMLLRYQSPSAAAEMRKQWQDEVALAQGKLQEFAKSGNAGVAGLAADMAKGLQEYAAAFAPVAEHLVGAQVNSVAAGTMEANDAGKLFDKLDAKLVTLVDLVQKDAEVSKAAQVAAKAQTKLIFIVALLIAVMVVVPLTLLNMQSICKPLEQARHVAQAIAGGDLAVVIKVEGKDEVSTLMHSLENMRMRLAQIVGELRASSESIANASQEIASGNHDLAARTERAASNVQSMVSSIAELSGTVRQTASAAQTANQLAGTASGQAQSGGAVVGQVVASMHGIAASSHKIGDIIGLIDAIAFQTNILALNAAVEAARAGEQGRGFAVVASEVRSLAQRSAAAANEIKALIQSSVQAVDGGVRLAESAGTVMQEMVGAVQRVGGIIDEISTAAVEQSSGIGGVNGTVQDIDQMTQQNAALVEQSSAAAESLREQAGRLAELVRQFRLREEGAPAQAALLPG